MKANAITAYEVQEKKTINVSIWLLRNSELAPNILNTKTKKGSFYKFGGMFQARPLFATYTSKIYLIAIVGGLWENLSFRKKLASWRRAQVAEFDHCKLYAGVGVVGETHQQFPP